MDVVSSGTITFLFTDLEGSTRLWEEHPDAMKDALQRHDAILRAAIDASHGQVVKTTGDGVMAVFDHAVDAATASLVAQRDVAKEAWAETGPLRVRMDLHAGPAEQRGGDYFGPTVNRTARTMAAGHGGQIFLSDSAATLASDHSVSSVGRMTAGRLRRLDKPARQGRASAIQPM